MLARQPFSSCTPRRLTAHLKPIIPGIQKFPNCPPPLSSDSFFATVHIQRPVTFMDLGIFNHHPQLPFYWIRHLMPQFLTANFKNFYDETPAWQWANLDRALRLETPSFFLRLHLERSMWQFRTRCHYALFFFFMVFGFNIPKIARLSLTTGPSSDGCV